LGVQGHEFVPNRIHAEDSRAGNDLKKIGPALVWFVDCTPAPDENPACACMSARYAIHR
jgi:hypothetical protein